MGHFVCPFTPLTICKIGILKKWKKHLQILLVYTSVSKMKSSCMVPEIWSMTDRMFVILGHILHFYYTSNLKIKVFKKLKKLKKKHLEILSFYICVPLMTIIWCMVPEIWSVTDIIFCHFESFFALLPLQKPKKSKPWKKWKKHRNVICILLHLMHATACAHPSTRTSSLVHVRNGTCHFCLWPLLSRILEQRKWKNEQKN